MVFDPQIVSQYGSYGQETAQKMYMSLSKHSLGLSYELSSRRFTVLGSDCLKIEQIVEIFSENTYRGWKPSVLKEVDSDGNHLVKLVVADDPDIDPDYRLFLARDPSRRGDHKAPLIQNFVNPTRGDYASQLISDLEYVGISFTERTCIDVGCRSGENSLAMQRAGANVIGVDPDDREFEIAIKNGLDKSQLVKATLQEYHELFPDKTFDLATVFLWNIPFKEYKAFVTCLKNIIDVNGLVIIGYTDEEYDNNTDFNVPALMKTAFHDVRRIVFERFVNRYVLVCSKPRN
jgi:SAM-dependent methyltransferase